MSSDANDVRSGVGLRGGVGDSGDTSVCRGFKSWEDRCVVLR